MMEYTLTLHYFDHHKQNRNFARIAAKRTRGMQPEQRKEDLSDSEDDSDYVPPTDADHG